MTNKLFNLIHLYIDSSATYSEVIKQSDWKYILKLSSNQGVLAIVWNAVNKLASEGHISAEQMPDKALKLQWALSAEKVKNRYYKQLRAAETLAEKFAKDGIITNVLKGFAISIYYPAPEYRECGDLDCYLSTTKADGSFVCRYDEGNKIAAKIGADVEIGFYKHSHISYKGLLVENHAFCTAIRGSKDRKALERHLQHLLATKPSTPINDTHLLRPCPDFNALFLIAHSFGHFLTEGIKLRHILDWSLFLQAEQNNIDWDSFYEWCDRMHYTKFADALTAISIEHFGLEINNSKIHTHSNLKDKVLEDVMYGNHSIHNTSASKFRKRLMIVRNRLFGGWKYKELYEKSAFIDTVQMVIAFFIERNPKI